MVNLIPANMRCGLEKLREKVGGPFKNAMSAGNFHGNFSFKLVGERVKKGVKDQVSAEVQDRALPFCASKRVSEREDDNSLGTGLGLSGQS